MSLKLLCVGDIHLGRRPSRLGEDLPGRVDVARLGPAAALEKSVDRAIGEQVDAVLFAGDLVEQADDFFEAYGDLERAVRRLEARRIPVLAVAGNHDTQVLPRLADSIEGLRLLGRGGVWETVRIDNAKGESVRITGWSFPEPRVSASPLLDGPAAPVNGNPPDTSSALIGLLHCDRDQSGSIYAPVRSGELEAAPVDAWLLGHIHKPDVLAGNRPIGYLGSLCGLDPGEPGPHGPWLVEISGPGQVAALHLPLAPLCWERVVVAVDGVSAPEDVDGLITSAIGDLHHELSEQGRTPLAVGCRLELRGRSRLGPDIARWLGAADPHHLLLTHDETTYFIEKVAVRIAPEISLDALAESSDPAGVLARRLLLLRRPESDVKRRELVEHALRDLSAVCRSAVYAELGALPPTPEQAVHYLESAGTRALEALLEQREQLYGQGPA